MIPRIKFRPAMIGFGAFILLVGLFLIFRQELPSTAESRFNDFFADLSVGTPGYQTLFEATHPSDVIKGDYCTLDFSQSSIQFREFLAKLGASEQKILSSSEVWITVNSKLNPEYPWHLLVHANKLNSPEVMYRVHIEGRQQYD